MAASLNKVMIIGRLGRDPEMRYTPSGSPVTNFSVAASRRWNSPSGEQREETEWFNVVAWDKLAEQCNEYLHKGRLVYIEGRLRTRSWEGTDGQKRYRTEVVAQQMMMLDSRPRDTQPAEEYDLGPMVEPDDLPFDGPGR